MEPEATNLPPPQDAAARIAAEHPKIFEAYVELGQACRQAGPITAHTARLVKIALAIGAGLEGAVHSHVRRGLAEGLSAAEMKHVALLAIPTLGFPAAARAATWIEDLTDRSRVISRD